MHHFLVILQSVKLSNSPPYLIFSPSTRKAKKIISSYGVIAALDFRNIYENWLHDGAIWPKKYINLLVILLYAPNPPHQRKEG